MIKVAFCDDNEEILNTIKGIVKEMHIDNDEVSYSFYSNPEILKLDNDKDVFDAIFLDIQMPEMDGMELADEPTGNLDSVNSEIVIKALKKGSDDYNQTIVMVTHDKDIAEYADRIIHMKDGKII